MKLPHGTLIVLADGQKHLVLENHGQPVAWDLQVRAVEETKLRPVSELGAERPGRYPIAGGRRTAVEQTDWKAQDRAAFAKALAEWINAEMDTNADRSIVLIAESKTLGLIRQSLSKQAHDAILKELSANYVSRTTDEIADYLKSA